MERDTAVQMPNLPIFLNPRPLGFWFYVRGRRHIAFPCIRALNAVLVTTPILRSLVAITCVHLSGLGVLNRLGCWGFTRRSGRSGWDWLDVLGSGTGGICRVRGIIRIIPVIEVRGRHGNVDGSKAVQVCKEIFFEILRFSHGDDELPYWKAKKGENKSLLKRGCGVSRAKEKARALERVNLRSELIDEGKENELC